MINAAEKARDEMADRELGVQERSVFAARGAQEPSQTIEHRS
jgi:hypothetical protein